MFKFVWDPAKALANFRKHRITFEEARTVFLDPMAIVNNDPGHSYGEARWMTLGFSDRARFLVVSHTEEGSTMVLRLISARPGTRAERTLYEEG